jgi:hypothetical protein
MDSAFHTVFSGTTKTVSEAFFSSLIRKHGTAGTERGRATNHA